MSLRRYIESFKEVKVVEKPVSKNLEITRILRENLTTPIFFKNLDGFQAIGNLWSTRERIARALGIQQKDLLEKILRAMNSPLDCEYIEKAPFMENVSKDFDLRDLPIPKWYPGDGGHYITSGVVVSEIDGKRNLSFHRMMVLEDKRLVARVVPRHLYAMHEKAKERGEELRIAIAIGLCPSILIAAGMSVDYETDELRIASALRHLTLVEKVQVVKIRNGLTVPAYTEYLLEGRMLHEKAKEGPFVDITGTYDTIREEPVIEIERIYHRKEPIFHALLPGGYEHYLFMGMPREPVIYQGVSKVVPKVSAVRLTEGGCCWLHGVVAIRKQKEGDGKNAILAALGAHPSMKKVVIVDEDIDIFDDREVEWAIATRFQADKDLILIEGARGSSLDPSAGETTAKIGMDATKPIGGRGYDRAIL